MALAPAAGAHLGSVLHKARLVIKENNARLARNEEQTRQNQEEVAKLTARLGKLTGETDGAVQSLVAFNEDTARVAAAKEDMELRFDGVTKTVNVAHALIAQQLVWAKNVKAQIACLQDLCNTYKEKLAVIEGVASSAEQIYLTSQANLQSQGDQARAQQTQTLAAIKEEISKLAKEIAAAQQSQSELNAQISAVRLEETQSLERMTLHQEEIEQLQGKHAKMHDNIGALREATQELEQRMIPHVQRTIEAMRLEFAKVTAERASHELRLRQVVDARLEAAQSRIGRALEAKRVSGGKTAAAQVLLQQLTNELAAREERAKADCQAELKKQCQERLAAKLALMVQQRDALVAQKQIMRKELADVKKKRQSAKRAAAAAALAARVSVPPPALPAAMAAGGPTAAKTAAQLRSFKTYHRKRGGGAMFADPLHRAPVSAKAPSNKSSKGLLYRWDVEGSGGASGKGGSGSGGGNDDLDIFTFDGSQGS